jgi:hypothetical protein
VADGLALTEEDLQFYRVYGPWQPYRPDEVAQLLQGFSRPWWIVGGHAIEAFTGEPREHEDVDISIFTSDFQALRAHIGDRFDLWSNDGGLLRHISDDHPEPLAPLAQTWVREHAMAPWVMDFILNGQGDGIWVARRDIDLTAPLDEVTWISPEGIRYLNPELVLFFKARLQRPKDQIDLTNSLPRLSHEQRTWLVGAVRHAYPDNPWIARLDEATRGGVKGENWIR